MSPIDFFSFLNDISKTPLFVMDENIPIEKYTPLDLSISNIALRDIDVGESANLEHYINNYIATKNALVAYGGYNEIRNIYQRSTYFNQTDIQTERNIHIGIDLWIAAETAIYAPLDGTVHSFKNNTNHGDYGPTIILRHSIEETVFFTLYGHLSLASIADLKVEQAFKRGEQLAALGDATVNGDYPPHLHFQIIKDREEFKGDYPGVCNRRDLKYYLQNCPNPNLLLKLG